MCADNVVEDVFGFAPGIDVAAKLDVVNEDAWGGRNASRGWDVAAPFQVGRKGGGSDFFGGGCGACRGMTGSGEAEEVGGVSGADGQMEIGILLAQGGIENDIGVCARSGGVVVEGVVDAVIGSSA